MVIERHKRAVGVFPSSNDAQQALQELTDSGFPIERISVLARDGDGSDIIPVDTDALDKSNTKVDEGARIGALSGGALGGLTGLLVGLGTLAIPGIGPIMLAGSLATALATTIAGAGLGAAAGGLIGSLIGLGVPEERARVYHDRVQKGDYLVIIDGTDGEIARAQTILHQWNVEEFGIYDFPNETNETVSKTLSKTPSKTVAAPKLTPQRAIGVFPGRPEVEAALSDLRYAGFAMDRVSLIAKDNESNGQRNLDREMRSEEIASRVPTDGAVSGLSFPGVGPVIAGGRAATAVATELSKATIGNAVEGISGALASLGITSDQARMFSDRFQRGEFLLIIDGAADQIHQAETILKHKRIDGFTVFSTVDDIQHN